MQSAFSPLSTSMIMLLHAGACCYSDMRPMPLFIECRELAANSGCACFLVSVFRERAIKAASKLLAVDLSLLFPAEHEKNRLVDTCVLMVRVLGLGGEGSPCCLCGKAGSNVRKDSHSTRRTGWWALAYRLRVCSNV
eukprot:1159553-Pelagomonas_calceolata.AAC.11